MSDTARTVATVTILVFWVIAMLWRTRGALRDIAVWVWIVLVLAELMVIFASALER